MYCKKCGREIPDTAIFCNYCGEETPPSQSNSIIDGDVRHPESEYEYRYKERRNRHFLFWLPALIFIPLLIMVLARHSVQTQQVRDIPYTPASSGSALSSFQPNREIEDQNINIETVRGGYLSDYSQTVTIGKAFENYFGEPQWKTAKYGGIYYVVFNGLATSAANSFTLRMEVLFMVNGSNFQVISWRIDGKEQTLESLPTVLNNVYGGGSN